MVTERHNGKKPPTAAPINQNGKGKRKKSTDGKSVQAQFEAALSLQQATFEATADGLLAVDKEGKIVTFNRRFLEMWRIPDAIIARRNDDEALGFVISQLKDPEAFLNKVRELYSQPEASSHDLVYLVDGRVFDRYSQPQKVGDQIVGRVWDFRDITEAKLAEAERERLIRQLRETSRFKDEFLSVMSHELRTPLNAIIGLLGIVLMGKTLKERESMMITRARANSERLLALINNILDISRIEAGRLEIVPSPVSVRSLVEQIQASTAVLAEQKGLQFSVSVDATLPETIQIDEDALNKIITNLVANAFKFTEKGSVSIRAYRRDENLVIEVKDTGIGIPAHMRDTIFESFRQVDASSTRAYGGTGLGLSIVQNLCTAMKGTVRVDSELGVGSAFIVTLPLQVEKVTSQV